MQLQLIPSPGMLYTMCSVHFSIHAGEKKPSCYAFIFFPPSFTPPPLVTERDHFRSVNCSPYLCKSHHRESGVRRIFPRRVFLSDRNINRYIWNDQRVLLKLKQNREKNNCKDSRDSNWETKLINQFPTELSVHLVPKVPFAMISPC